MYDDATPTHTEVLACLEFQIAYMSANATDLSLPGYPAVYSISLLLCLVLVF